jgi:hypothetical protein
VNATNLNIAAMRAVHLRVRPDNVRVLHEIAVQYALSADEERRMVDIVSGLDLAQRAGVVTGPSVRPLMGAAAVQPFRYDDALESGLESIVDIGDGPDIRGWLLSIQTVCRQEQNECFGTIPRGKLWNSFKNYYAGVSGDGLRQFKDRIVLFGLPANVVSLVKTFAESLEVEQRLSCCGTVPWILFLCAVGIGLIIGAATCTAGIEGFGGTVAGMLGSGGGIILAMTFIFTGYAVCSRKNASDNAYSAEEEYITRLGLRIVDDGGE